MASTVIVRITAKSWKNNLQRRLTYRPVNTPVENIDDQISVRPESVFFVVCSKAYHQEYQVHVMFDKILGNNFTSETTTFYPHTQKKTFIQMTDLSHKLLFWQNSILLW